MLRGLYSAASGMLATISAQEVITNNLANVNTPGFKRDIPVYESFSNILWRKINQDTSQIRIQNTVIDLRQGKLTFTDNVFDFALEGEGFFVLSTPQGIAYTRAGSFSLDEEGQLVNSDGYALLGEAGPIVIPEEKITGLEFSERGEVIVDGRVIDQIRVDEVTDPYLLGKEGDNLLRSFAPTASISATAVRVKQGYLETSNVEIIPEMVNLIDNLRTYEANQKMIQLQDDILKKLCNELGATR